MPSAEVAGGIPLDTHCWYWLALGDPRLRRRIARRLERAAAQGQLFVHAISVWEIAMLESRGRLAFNLPVADWIERALRLPGLNLIGLDVDIAIASTRIPGLRHADPSDRMILAAAHLRQLALATADEVLLRFCRGGFARCIPARQGRTARRRSLTPEGSLAAAAGLRSGSGRWRRWWQPEMKPVPPADFDRIAERFLCAIHHPGL